MKTTLCISLLLLATFACGTTDDLAPAPGPAPGATTDPPVTEPPAPKRTMGTAPAMGTRPENLVFDPTFGSFGTQYSQAVLVQDAKGHVETPATSPAGPAQPVIVTSPDGAQPVLLFAVQGGTGPLDVRLFVSTKEATGPRISLITRDGSLAFDVEASPSEAQKHGDRTYKLYTAHITDELFGKLYLIVEPSDGEVVVAAPEVTSPAATTAKSRVRPAARVSLTPGAARALRTVASLPIFHGALPRPHVQR